jgi:hypothetical protein
VSIRTSLDGVSYTTNAADDNLFRGTALISAPAVNFIGILGGYRVAIVPLALVGNISIF